MPTREQTVKICATCRRLLTATLMAALLIAPAPASAAEPGPEAEGLWQGVIFLEPGRQEIELVVELAHDSSGQLVGTLDIPTHGLQYQNLEEVRQQGDEVSFTFSRFSTRLEQMVRSPFRGTIEAGGERITGTYLEGGVNSYSFVLHRQGPPGSERPEPARQPLHRLSDGGEELQAAFNADRGRTRVLLLISPTCPVCQMSSRIVYRYVLEQMPDEELRMYVVWGPMQHKETEEDARAATANVPDPRATHFWTDDHVLAQAFQKPLGIEGQPAWDTYMVYGPEARWEEEPPAPAYFMHIEKPLPDEIWFNGVTFAEHVRELLGGG